MQPADTPAAGGSMTGLEAAEVCIRAGLPSAVGYTPTRLLRHYGADLLRDWVGRHDLVRVASRRDGLPAPVRGGGPAR